MVALAVTPLALINGIFDIHIFLSHDVIPKVILILASAAGLLFLLPRWLPSLAALWERQEGRMFLMLVIAQLASLGLSTLFSSQPALSLAGTVWRRFGMIEQTAALLIATGVVCLAAAQPRWAGHLMHAVFLCGGVAALYGILQYFGVDPFLWPELYTLDIFGSVTRPPGTLGHAIYFSAYLVPVALLAASSAETESQKIWRRVAMIVALLTCVAILLAGSRGAVLAVAGGLLFLAWHRKRRLRLVLGTAFVLTFALTLALSPAGDNFRRRVVQWRSDLGGSRLSMWEESPALIGKHPWLGSGPETFATEFRAIQSAAFSRAYPDFYQETPHNAFLDAAIAQGLPGALILVGVFVLGLYPWPGRSVGLQAALIGILIASIFASFTLVTAIYLWTVAGLGLGVSYEPNTVTRPEVRKSRTTYYPAFATGVLFLLAAIALGEQDRAYAALLDDAASGNLAGATRDYAIATVVSAGMPGYELWSSRQFAVLRAWDKASEAAGRAETRSEDRFSATYQSSVLAVAAGDLTQAESKARETIRLAPNWYKPHLILAQILQAMGRNAEATEQFQISRDLGWREY
jgi:putative inorganic carbon (HCO3(-)) transporter